MPFFRQSLIWTVPVIFLLLVIVLLPFEHIPTYRFDGYTIKLSYLASIACLLSLSLQRPWIWLKRFPISMAERALIVFSIYSAFLALTIAPDRTRSVIFVLIWTFVFLMSSVASRLLADPRVRLVAEHLLLGVTALVCLFGIYQYLGDSFGLPADLTGLRLAYTKMVFGFPRIQSVALEPLYFSNYLLVPLFLCAYRFLRHPRPGKYFLLLILIVLNLTLGISRGAYAAAVVGSVLLTIFLLLNKAPTIRRIRIFQATFAVGLAVLLAVLGIYGINGKKASSNFVGHALVADAPKEASVQDRFSTDRQAWRFFLQRPLTGFGPSSFGILSETSPEDQRRVGYGIVNNEYLELLVETGALGFIVFLTFLIATAVAYFKRLPLLVLDDRLHSFCYFCGIVGILIQYNFFSTLYILYIWIFIGMLNSFVRQQETVESVAKV